MNYKIWPVVLILAGLASIVFNKRFAYLADNYHKRLLRRRFNDEAVLRFVYVGFGIFLIAMGFFQLFR